MSVLYLNLANTYYLCNNTENAIEFANKAEKLIVENGYQYWEVYKNLIKIKIRLLESKVSFRLLLREALSHLSIIRENHYFLLEIELYSIIIHLYNELNAYNHSQSYFKLYCAKVNDVARNLPENMQQNYIEKLKKTHIKNIRDFSFLGIVPRYRVKPTEWNEEILSLLRLDDVSRIKSFLNDKIIQYFAPHSHAIIIFRSGKPQTNLTKSAFTIYSQNNFNEQMLSDESVISQIVKVIDSDKSIQFRYKAKKAEENALNFEKTTNVVVSPLFLKHSRIGFWILTDEGELPYSSDEIKTITAFSFHLSTMLIRLSEFEEENRRIRLGQDLMNITGNMIKTYDIKVLEHTLVYNILTVTQGTRGYLFKLDPNKNYTYSVAIDRNNNMLDDASKISISLVAEVYSKCEPIFIEDFYKREKIVDTLFSQREDIYLLDNKANSVYCAPIMVENEVYAVLYLDNYLEEVGNLNVIPDMMNIFLIQVSLALLNAKTYKSLISKNMELHTLDILKNKFMAIVSHELNTPLFTLQEYVQKLKRVVDSEDSNTSDILTKVDKDIKKLNSTISDILTLNNYTGSNVLSMQQTDVIELMKRVIADIEKMSLERRMKFKLDVPIEKLIISINPVAIETLIRCLLYNSVRFTADYGYITLGIRYATFPEEKIADRDTITIFVNDNGIGIPEKELNKVFTAFYELGDIYSHRSGYLEFRSGGLGVGLAIAQKITELHEGKIWCRSNENEGTTFYVSLPT
jgi:signal transduction histidine kinase